MLDAALLIDFEKEVGDTGIDMNSIETDSGLIHDATLLLDCGSCSELALL